jgi:transposase
MSQRQPKTSYWQDAPQPRDQLVLFQETLGSRIPDDHPVRLLDEILDRLDWTAWEANYDGKRGQPPIHPSLMCKVLLFALIRRVRSSRQIEYHLKHSIDFMWLASGRVIDHSTLSQFHCAHRVALKELHQQMVGVAINMGLAKLSELCVDGTRVLANASRHKRWTQEQLESVLEQLDATITSALADLEQADKTDDLLDGDGTCGDKLPSELADKVVRREELQRIFAALQEMGAARKAKGRDGTPAQIPQTDPDARILPNKEGGFAANYTPIAVTETENGFIVGADVVIGSVEHTKLLSMVEEVRAAYSQDVTTVLADGAFATGENLRDCEAADIELLSPLSEPNQSDNPALRDDTTQPVPAEQVQQLPIMPQTKCFDRSAFVYDEEADCYHCPQGKRLDFERCQKTKRGGITVVHFTYRCHSCAGCPLAAKCKTNPESPVGRSVSHDEYEPHRRRHRARMQSEESQTRYRKRLHYGETQFAVLKSVLGMRRFLLRGLAKVQTEWLWGCAAFNLKKLIHLTGAMRASAKLEVVSSTN